MNILKCKNLESKNLTITDGTSGVGGDIIRFAKHFNFVNAIEISATHSSIIENNIKQYEYNNTNVINSDYTKVYNNIEQDIIYLDSPWGGGDYVKDSKINLVMFGSSLTFNEFVKNILLKNPDIILIIKCPINFSIIDISETILNSEQNILNSKKMKIVGVKNFLLVCFF